MPQSNRAGIRLNAPGLIVVLMVVSVLIGVPGCASAGFPSPTPSTSLATVSPTVSSTSPAPTSTAPTSPAPTGTAATSTAPKKRNVIEWILGLGVDAPSGPTGHKEDMFRALGQRHCELVDNEFPVLGAAAAACLAASGTGDTDLLWTQATQVRDATDADALDCMDAAAYQLLDALVEAHQDHPELPFRFTTGDGGSTSTCLAVSSVQPAEGTSGDLVTIRGRNLHRATAVQLADPTSAADVTATIVRQSRTRLQVRLPADIEGAGENLWILWQEPSGQSTAWVPFSYRPQPGGDGSTEGEDSTTDEDSTADEGGSDQEQSPPEEPASPETAPPDPASPSPAP